MRLLRHPASQAELDSRTRINAGHRAGKDPASATVSAPAGGSVERPGDGRRGVAAGGTGQLHGGATLRSSTANGVYGGTAAPDGGGAGSPGSSRRSSSSYGTCAIAESAAGRSAAGAGSAARRPAGLQLPAVRCLAEAPPPRPETPPLATPDAPLSPVSRRNSFESCVGERPGGAARRLRREQQALWARQHEEQQARQAVEQRMAAQEGQEWQLAEQVWRQQEQDMAQRDQQQGVQQRQRHRHHERRRPQV